MAIDVKRSARHFLLGALLLGGMALLGQDRTGLEPATIQGKVVSAPTSQPLEGVLVTLSRGSVTLRVQTDQDGSFAIGNVPSGSYTLTASKNGFFRPTRAAGPAKLSLLPGQRLAGIQLKLEAASAITGRIIDESGQPVDSVRVAAVRVQYINGRRRIEDLVNPGAFLNSPVIQVTRTDDRGTYRLFGLEPGEYYVAVLRASIAEPRILPPVFYPGVTDPETAVKVVARPGMDATAIDFPLLPQRLYTVRFQVSLPGPPFDCSAYPPAVSSSFQLVQMASSSLEWTHFVQPDVLFVQPDLQSVSAFQRRGENGWTSPGLLPGSYDIYYRSCPQMLPGPVGHLRVHIVDRDVDAGVLVMRTPVALRGRLLNLRALSGNVDVKQLRISLIPLDNRHLAFAPRFARLIGEDAFSFEFDAGGSMGAFGTVPEGHYRVVVTAQPPDVYLASVRYAGQNKPEHDLVVDGDPTGLLELTFATGGTVSGFVLDRANLPAADVKVVLVPEPRRRGNPTLFRLEDVDQRGTFGIRGVAPGEYSIFASENRYPDGAYLDPEFLKTFEPRAVKVSVRAGSDANINLRPIP